MASLEAVRLQLTQENASLRRSIEDMLGLLRSTSEAVEGASMTRGDSVSRRSSVSFVPPPAKHQIAGHPPYQAAPGYDDVPRHTGERGRLWVPAPEPRATRGYTQPPRQGYETYSVEKAHEEQYQAPQRAHSRRRDMELLDPRDRVDSREQHRRGSVSRGHSFDETVLEDEEDGYSSVEPPPQARRGRQEHGYVHLQGKPPRAHTYDDGSLEDAGGGRVSHRVADSASRGRPLGGTPPRETEVRTRGHSAGGGRLGSKEPVSRQPFLSATIAPPAAARQRGKQQAGPTATELALTLGRTKARVGALLTRCAILDTKRTQAEEELASYRASAEAAQAAAASEIAALKALVARLSTDLDAATSRADKAEGLVVTQGAAVDRLEERLNTLTYERDLALDRVRVLQAQKDGAQATAEGLTRTVDALLAGSNTATTAVAAAAAAAAAVASTTPGGHHQQRRGRAAALRHTRDVHPASPPRSVSSTASRHSASESIAAGASKALETAVDASQPLPDVRAMMAAKRRGSVPESTVSSVFTATSGAGQGAVGGTEAPPPPLSTTASVTADTARMTIEVPRRVGEAGSGLAGARSPPRPATKVVELGALQWAPERPSSPESPPAPPSPARTMTTRAARPAPQPASASLSATAPPVITRHHNQSAPLGSPPRPAAPLVPAAPAVFSPVAAAAAAPASPAASLSVPWVETLRSEVATLRAENLRLRAGISGTEASLAIAQRHVVALERDLAVRHEGGQPLHHNSSTTTGTSQPSASGATNLHRTAGAVPALSASAPATAFRHLAPAALQLPAPEASAGLLSPSLLSARSGGSRGFPGSPLMEFSAGGGGSSSNPSVRDILVLMGAVSGSSPP